MNISNQVKLSPYIIPGIIYSPQKLESDVLDYFGVTAEELRSKSQKSKLVLPRQVVMYLYNQFTETGHKEIAKEYNRERTNVIHSVDLIHDYLHTKTETDIKIRLRGFMKFYGYPVKKRISRSHANLIRR